ncbi:tripartite tricarboxylate transporter substrate binding protein [Caenimonas sedimenti]|uniref:Tripartite tricarboxylate transporter substrate binding protein n=1 Tax=Caenimonas sedimenti TaxID=2596921 RepID=A0A562ZM53_9BURK|nr:tripartite tricarboxylate transporter substrate binding protein [Caenimonas sedimenti]TWO69481.1 tripartite tricarboxylate transporter substrate binding protein [Caenimonas sedimenti]
MNKPLALALATLPILFVHLGLAHAQEAAYPNKPITVLVGYPPGGSTDLTGRAVADQLAKKLGVPVVVENASGAGGAIAAMRASRAQPDGYTLLLGANNEIAINRLIAPASVKYSYKDFTPVGLVATTPMVLVASAGTGVKTAEQFLSTVKSKPGRFSYGSSGVGTALHLAGEMVKDQGGLFMTHIPYRGVSPLTIDLVGGALDYGVFVLSSGLPHIRSGKVVALGVTQKHRSPAAPDIPALAESPKLKNLDIDVWFALMAPPKLPAPILARLRTALNETLQTPEFRKKLEESGSAIAPLNVDMASFLETETAKYQKIVDFAKIKE